MTMLERKQSESSLTRSIAAFAANRFSADSWPQEARQMARSALIDTAAVMLAGQNEPTVHRLIEFITSHHKAGNASSLVFGCHGRAAAHSAAFVNAAAAHVLDYDDIAFKAHPSAILVPAILAVAEEVGASGPEFISAYLVGYEVWAELASRELDSYHEKGWHPSSALGAVATACALGNLLKLDQDLIINAIGIAVAHCGGVTGNFGSMSKHLQVARAAGSAVEAIAMARLGMTGSPDVLEHHGGLLQALSPRGRVAVHPFLPHELHSVTTPLDFKRYPVCYGAHRLVDGIMAMRDRHEFDLADISQITLRLRAPQNAILRSRHPRTSMEARFSAEYAVAAALQYGQLTLQELQTDKILAPEVQRLIGLIRRDVAPSGQPSYTTERIWVTLASGLTLDSGDLPKAKSHDNLREKFMDCAAIANFQASAELYERLDALESILDFRHVANGQHSTAQLND